MEKTIGQVEKNVSASFGYVKKDMLMLNDAFSDLHDKMQHLSMNHASLLGEIERLRERIAGLDGKKTPVKKNARKKVVAKKTSDSDDLTKIEGIGPAISSYLKRQGIKTYRALGKSKVGDLKEILEKGGNKYKMHNPSSWPRQARLAQKGKWTELGKLQEQLLGGVKRK